MRFQCQSTIWQNQMQNQTGLVLKSSRLFPLSWKVAFALKSLTCMHPIRWLLILVIKALRRRSVTIVGKADSCVLFYRNPRFCSLNLHSSSRCICLGKKRDSSKGGCHTSWVEVLIVAKICLRQPHPKAWNSCFLVSFPSPPPLGSITYWTLCLSLHFSSLLLYKRFNLAVNFQDVSCSKKLPQITGGCCHGKICITVYKYLFLCRDT